MRIFTRLLFCCVVLSVSLQSLSQQKNAQTADASQVVDASKAVLERVTGNSITNVKLSYLATATGIDSFHVKAENGQLAISGNSVSAICFGFHQYLKKYCNIMYTWSSGTITPPASWPNADLIGGTPYQYRYYLNVVTFGYTTPYWDWARWEKELDWMAMHGINMPLATVASEAIAERVWLKLGLKKKDMDDFFTGPAHLPWHRMGNLNKWDGPIPDGWHNSQLQLQKKIMGRIKELGFTPITPAFAGFVAPAFAKLHPELKLNPLKWGGFAAEDNGYVLSPETGWFKKIGKLFIEEWEKEFGKNKYYLADCFNEMDVPVDNDHPEKKYSYLANYGRSVYESIISGNPDAVWVTQGWTFGYQHKFWDKPTLQSLLSKVPDDKMMIIDLGNDYPPYVWHIDPVWKTHAGFYGKQWIYSFVPNFGGKTPYTGVVSFYASAPIEALKSPYSKSMIGYGHAPEGIENNELIYELISDMGWTNKEINLEEWGLEYCRARYGDENTSIVSAGQALFSSCYDSFGSYPRFVWQTVKYDTRRKGSVNDDPAFFKGVKDFLAAAGEMKDNKMYRYDALELSSLYLGLKADEFYKQALQADSAGNDALKTSLGNKAMLLLLQVDSLLESHPMNRLQNWIDYARLHGNNEKDKNYYESNAKRLITTWGGFQDDYAARIWSGLIRDYYVPRVRETLFNKNFDRKNWEERWVTRPGISKISPYPDPLQKAIELVNNN
ncbi:alpha-N-acetylglucosaminidase [Pseudoflavitalea rhizosphaerae]|uniref:alpha-N-acetylglucosaminidase n=1 Tax=Pseudoflavitalea rhizosphaerae TaxID=1884793 RepID=UPI000F8D3F0E|nr:alpha-N-acetylglucosaminidase [Pseudoflavitalea rhizosphaerae]